MQTALVELGLHSLRIIYWT